MPKQSWEVNDNHIKQAEIGVHFQVTVHGLDMNDPAIRDFVQHTVLVQAAMAAESMWLRQIINRRMEVDISVQI